MHRREFGRAAIVAWHEILETTERFVFDSTKLLNCRVFLSFFRLIYSLGRSYYDYVRIGEARMKNSGCLFEVVLKIVFAVSMTFHVFDKILNEETAFYNNCWKPVKITLKHF